jgi:hypothetical protein
MAAIIRNHGRQLPPVEPPAQIERILEINGLDQVTKTVEDARESLVIGQPSESGVPGNPFRSTFRVSRF